LPPPRPPLSPYPTLFRSCEVAFAVRGQPHRARAADEQPGAELLFQPADLVADRRRAQRQVAGGAAEAELRRGALEGEQRRKRREDRKSTRLNSSHVSISY